MLDTGQDIYQSGQINSVTNFLPRTSWDVHNTSNTVNGRLLIKTKPNNTRSRLQPRITRGMMTRSQEKRQTEENILKEFSALDDVRYNLYSGLNDQQKNNIYKYAKENRIFKDEAEARQYIGVEEDPHNPMFILDLYNWIREYVNKKNDAPEQATTEQTTAEPAQPVTQPEPSTSVPAQPVTQPDEEENDTALIERTASRNVKYNCLPYPIRVRESSVNTLLQRFQQFAQYPNNPELIVKIMSACQDFDLANKVLEDYRLWVQRHPNTKIEIESTGPLIYPLSTRQQQNEEESVTQQPAPQEPVPQQAPAQIKTEEDVWGKPKPQPYTKLRIAPLYGEKDEEESEAEEQENPEEEQQNEEEEKKEAAETEPAPEKADANSTPTDYDPDAAEKLSDPRYFPWRSKLKDFMKSNPGQGMYTDRPPDKSNRDTRDLQRPTYSPFRNAYQIDIMFSDENKGRYSVNYLVMINVNTRYLMIARISHKTTSEVMKAISGFIDAKYNYVTIDYLSGDKESAFVSMKKILEDYWKTKDTDIPVKNPDVDYNLSIFKHEFEMRFEKQDYVNQNRIVDSVIRTIRDGAGLNPDVLRDPKKVQDLVRMYNHTPHDGVPRKNGRKMTPAELQTDPDMEWQYVREKDKQLHKVVKNIKDKNLTTYTRGNILRLHLPKGKTRRRFKKSRMIYENVGIFDKYVNGNCRVWVLEFNKFVEVPIYYTNKIAESFDTIPDQYNYFYRIGEYLAKSQREIPIYLLAPKGDSKAGEYTIPEPTEDKPKKEKPKIEDVVIEEEEQPEKVEDNSTQPIVANDPIQSEPAQDTSEVPDPSPDLVSQIDSLMPETNDQNDMSLFTDTENNDENVQSLLM